MTEAQKYQKKKNSLIMVFMLLLVVFVGLICYIFIYAKNNPKRVYDDPSTIEIKEMQISEYNQKEKINYTELTESTDFIVKAEELNITLEINENKEIIRSDNQEKVSIIVNNNDINNNIKVIYQSENDNLLLTEEGLLYRVSENIMTETNNLSAGQILSNIEIKNIVKIPVKTDSAYILTADNKVINVNTQKEYDSIIRELTTNDGILYIYDDYSITFEKGKVITDTEGNNIKFNVLFDNKLVDSNSVIYDIDFMNQKVSTSNLGKLEKSGYGKTDDTDYNINIETNTGIHKITSSYYYTR